MMTNGHEQTTGRPAAASHSHASSSTSQGDGWHEGPVSGNHQVQYGDQLGDQLDAATTGMPTLGDLAALSSGGEAGRRKLRDMGGVEGVLSLLRVSAKKGVGGEKDASWRREKYGANEYPQKAARSFWYFVLEAMGDTLVQILFVCAIASIAVSIPTEGASEGWYDGVGIFIALFIIITVAAISNYRQSIQFRKLNQEKEKVLIQVTRNSMRAQVDVHQLVVGDIVHLTTGDYVHADGLLLEAHSLAVDESSLTGESELVAKDRSDPFLLGGCTILEGFGSMVVTNVGLSTEWGRVMASVTEEDDDDPTPLQVRLAKVAALLGWMGIIVGVAIFLILSIRYLVEHASDGQLTGGDVRVLLDYFTIAITVLVIAVPEGLPLAVTLTLAFSVGRMMADKSLVRHLQSCETMGCATTICSDKTGTLTMNQMAVLRSWVAGVFVSPGLPPPQEKEPFMKTLLQGVALNTSGSLQQQKDAPPIATGSPTEKALLLWAADMGISFGQARAGFEILSVEPFSSEKKVMGVMAREVRGRGGGGGGGGRVLGASREHGIGHGLDDDEGLLHDDEIWDGKVWEMEAAGATDQAEGRTTVHWKGAPDFILASCRHVIGPNGKVEALTAEKAEIIRGIVTDMGHESLRTIAFAFREVGSKEKEQLLRAVEMEANSGGKEMEGLMPVERQIQNHHPHAMHPLPVPRDGLILLALIGIKDPCRPEVPFSVQRCQEAGITVRMVTGDSPETAAAIAKECGILTEGGVVVEGHRFRNLAPAEVPGMLDNLQVLARASPSDKLELVRLLRAKGDVVAVTGDGTNDAPALKEADIGLAMGICGTEVAKESADIIILDDNFASIVRTVTWGRSVFSNIQRFLQFQITVNVVALSLNFVSAVITGDAPLTAVQMLWVDLIQDTLGALSLATEPPTERLLASPPVGRDDQLVSAVMWRNVIGQSIYQLTVLLLLWFDGKRLLSLPGPDGIPKVVDHSENGTGISESDATMVTIIFCTFVFCQIFNQINSRKLDEWNIFRGIFSNPLFVCIIAIEFTVQVLITQFLGEFAGCVPLSMSQWLLCFLLGAGCLLAGFVAKLVPLPGQKKRRKKNRQFGGATSFVRLEES